jgi:hypothetical protein
MKKELLRESAPANQNLALPQLLAVDPRMKKAQVRQAAIIFGISVSNPPATSDPPAIG